jgi:hypothetical protein
MGKIKAESLPLLAKFLDEIYPQGYPKISFEGELACGLDIIQRTFTNGGIGGGHLCPQAFIEYFKSCYHPTEEYLWDNLMKKPQLVFFVAHPRREETTRKLKEYFALVDQWNITPYEQSLKKKNPCSEFLTKNKYNLIFSVFLPALDRAMEQSYRGKAEFEATRTVVALFQYKHDRGRYPESLSELVPGYLKELPRDPYGPDILSYRQNGEDFLLYSWGVDFEDNGGKHLSPWGKGKQRKDSTGRTIGENGDYVFWPPARPVRQK